MKQAVKDMALKINDVILTPILYLLIMSSAILFFWGLAEFILFGNDGDRKKGKDHILWGLIGLFIALAAWGFVNLIQSTLDTVVAVPAV